MIRILPFAILSALFYRLGGWGGEGRIACPNLRKWLFDTKARDVGCALLAVDYMLIRTFLPWYIYLTSFLLLFGALTTYWDFVPFNKGQDNFWMVGFMYALAFFPFAFYLGWLPLLYRVVMMTAFTGMWSYGIGKAWIEEAGRGFFIIITLPIIV